VCGLQRVGFVDRLRKNFLFVGNEDAGDNIAGLYSLVATCEANDVNPLEYLRDVLLRISTHPADRIDELLPDRWNPAESAKLCKGVHSRTLTFHQSARRRRAASLRPAAPEVGGETSNASAPRAYPASLIRRRWGPRLLQRQVESYCPGPRWTRDQ
jgi:hypothetical protein